MSTSAVRTSFGQPNGNTPGDQRKAALASHAAQRYRKRNAFLAREMARSARLRSIAADDWSVDENGKHVPPRVTDRDWLAAYREVSDRAGEGYGKVTQQETSGVVRVIVERVPVVTATATMAQEDAQLTESVNDAQSIDALQP